jgi:hypothetical protein
VFEGLNNIVKERPLPQFYRFLKRFIAQKISYIHLLTKDYKIVPLTNLPWLSLAGRVIEYMPR